MTERLLQFIWRMQYFNKSELRTINSEPLQIISAGEHNSNQGPDFRQGRIRIDQTVWAGNIELHLKTSDWNKHRHQEDPNYENVILHVVWQHDASQNNIPVLELEGRVSKILLQRYEELLQASSFIPCERMICTVKDITWKSWKDRLLAERLLRKAANTTTLLNESKQHWEELFWWLLARNFGGKVNGSAFEAMARSIPVELLARHKTAIHQLEALLFGQSGLLDARIKDDHYKLLQREFRFLKGKYKLQPIHHPIHFLRMRPAGFPTIRLAQLAALVRNSAHLFSKIRETDQLQSIKELFDVNASDYWNCHYRFGEGSIFKIKNLGADTIDSIVINTITPVLFAYGNFQDEQKYRNKALQWLEQTSPESNAICKGFLQIGIENKNAFDSQALIELKNEYCNPMRCLECGVGNAILKTT